MVRQYDKKFLYYNLYFQDIPFYKVTIFYQFKRLTVSYFKCCTIFNIYILAMRYFFAHWIEKSSIQIRL